MDVCELKSFDQAQGLINGPSNLVVVDHHASDLTIWADYKEASEMKLVKTFKSSFI